MNFNLFGGLELEIGRTDTVSIVFVLRNPVKKSLLVHEDPALTPRQRVELRKKQRADKEAERIKLEAAQNYNEGRKRFKEHKKKQVNKLK